MAQVNFHFEGYNYSANVVLDRANPLKVKVSVTSNSQIQNKRKAISVAIHAVNILGYPLLKVPTDSADAIMTDIPYKGYAFSTRARRYPWATTWDITLFLTERPRRVYRR